MRVALAGNPNSGKTTLFNALTGNNQHVGNWPGVTVEKKGGKLKADKSIEITDLPGIYSLSPYTLEEVVARNYIIEETPDAILNIVDGSNLERNLYLTTQLLEMGIPVIVAVNMMDIVRKRGDEIHAEELAAELGCNVVEISALKNEGIDEIVNCLQTVGSASAPKPITFSASTEEALATIQDRLPADTPEKLRRFYAVKLLEKDSKISAALSSTPDVSDVVAKVEADNNDDTESVIINDRYAYITGIIDRCRNKGAAYEMTTSDKIDRVVTNRILALPIFVVVMFLVYYISVTTVGTVATDWANDGVFGDGWFLDPSPIVGIDGSQAAFDEVAEEYDGAVEILDAGIGGTVEAYDDETGENEVITVTQDEYNEAVAVVESYGETADEYGEAGPEPSEYGIWIPGIPVFIEDGLNAIGCADWLQALILDGIVAGVGAVLGFVPQMLVLFLLLAFLESCGYMARIAFILDRVFRRFGLSGKSFVPILIGTGCGVPGVMASRTIENQNDRRMTVMTTTFIPCGAKLPIIALFAGAVFGGVWWVAPSAYFLGIAAILCSGVILKKTRFFAGDTAPFVMELPPYHLPTPGAVLRSMWERGWSFIKKAGTIILVACILVWFISSYGFVDGVFQAVEDQNDSILAILGSAICWIWAPNGFGNWQAAAGTITGLIAKENVVSTFGILYDGGAGWYANVQASYTLAAAYSFLAFNLLCAPCFAAMGAIKREMNNTKWFFAAIGYQCGIAWIVSLWIYQFAALVVGEIAPNVFTVVALATFIAFLWLLFRPNKWQNKEAVRAVDATDAA